MTVLLIGLGVGLGSGLVACGGGITDDDNGQASSLVCANACVPSSSVPSGQMRPSLVLVSDGQQAQAQAAFSTGSDPRFNVEIQGGDRLTLKTPQDELGFHIPAGSLGTLFVDAFSTLLIGATPYLSSVPLASDALPVEFRFSRADGVVHRSTVTLPAPFRIIAPVGGTVWPVATRALPLRIERTDTAPTHKAQLSCRDVNGNTASGSDTLAVIAGSATRDATSQSVQLDLGNAVDRLSFTTAFPRGAVDRCTVELKVLLEVSGQLDAGFAPGRVFAQQIRSVTLTLDN